MTRRLRVGTRGSPLALAQTARVVERLRRARPDLDAVVVPVRTEGDRHRDRPLAAFAAPGVFVKELEAALAGGRVDLAVHSAKDVPTALPPGLALAAFPERAPAWDVLVTAEPWPADGDGLPRLPAGARLATGSVRRRALLRAWRPDLRLEDLRGNVDTRLRRLLGGDVDGLVLAAAGLVRLGILAEPETPPGEGAGGRDALRGPLPLSGPGEGLWAYPLDPARFVPAPGQGALAVEVRADDREVRALAAALDDPAVSAAVRAERAFLAGVGASCAVPVGAHARVSGGRLVLRAYYAGAPEPHAVAEGAPEEAEDVGRRLAARMRPGGAGEGP